MFERALELYRSVGDVGGQAEAQFWIGAFHQVGRDDMRPQFLLSSEPGLSRPKQTIRLSSPTPCGIWGSSNIAPAISGKRVATWRSQRRLRRRLGFGPGVAANLVGLAYLAAADGRDEEVPAILDEAECLASGSDAAGITRKIEEARRGLTR